MTKPQLQPNAGRNEACPCGSQKKYKKCCGSTAAATMPSRTVAPLTPLVQSADWAAIVQAFESGNLAQAQEGCEVILRHTPHHADALHVRAMIALQQQDYQTALSAMLQAIEQVPTSSLFFNSLGNICQEMKQAETAEAAYRKALQCNPTNAIAANNLGDLLHSQARINEAENYYREALRQQPDFPEAHNNLGLLLLIESRLEQAIEHFVQALQLRPEYLKALYNLSRALREQGRLPDAQAVLERATQVNPQFAEAWHDLGITLLAQQKRREGMALLEKAIQLNPLLDTGYMNIGNSYYELGLTDVAQQYFRRAQAVHASDALRLKMALCLPATYDSVAHLQEVRAQLMTDVDQLLTENLQVSDPQEQVAVTPFYLAYHGENEVTTLSRIGDLFLQACPALGMTAPHCLRQRRSDQPLKIGFLSSSFVRENHIVNRVVGGLIAHLPREQFQVTLLHQAMPCGEIVRYLREGDHLLQIPPSLKAARERIASAELDILFYCDLGMEPWSYFLSFARLAPVQITSGGHPITSGVPNLDYFVSSQIEEVPHAQEHYRERLLTLPQRPICYTPAERAAQAKTRTELGLPEHKRIYLCPMTPFKLHPATDQIFGEILRADGDGEIVFVVNSQAELWERLKQRFARTLPDVYTRLRFLPFMLMPDFIELVQQADVLLDTISFGGGSTAMEALAVGTPVITLPGQLLRQRGAFGMYKQMELLDCVAQDEADYVRLATQIARSPEQREHLKQQILARNSGLFGRTDWIPQLSEFLQQAVTQLS